ncbi:hypothetical protein BDW75DRAFT_151167 [Aspergillus navahoensis]
MDPSQDAGSQPSAVETAPVMLQSASTSRSLSPRQYPWRSPITTFADLLHEIRHQYTQLPPALFLDLFLEAQAIVGELFHQQARPLMQTLVEFEAIGTQITGFKEYMESDEYQDRFPEFKAARDYVSSNRAATERARRDVPIAYPTYGRALLALYDSQGWARNLKTLTNKFPDESDGIAALNRAILDRVQKAKASPYGRKGQKATICILTSDLDAAKRANHRTLNHPTAKEILREKLYIHPAHGTLTSTPPAELSLAETIGTASPALTPHTVHTLPLLRPSTPPASRLFAETISTDSQTPAPRPQRILPSSTDASGNEGSTGFTTINASSPVLRTAASAAISPGEGSDGETTPADLKCMATSPSPGDEAQHLAAIPNHPAINGLDESTCLHPGDPGPQQGGGLTDEGLLGELPDSQSPCLCETGGLLTPELLSAIVVEGTKQRPQGSVSVDNCKAWVDLLQKIAEPLKQAAEDSTLLCHEHLRLVCRASGLDPAVSDSELAARLAAIAENCSEVEQFHEFIYRSSRRSRWLARPRFEYNQYRMFHFHLDMDPRSLLARDGYVDVRFRNPYLDTPEMRRLFETETRIINHHTSAVAGMRWARQFSIAQQAEMHDIGRYFVDVLLRPDHPHDLIAYPQPTIETLADSDPPSANAPFHVPLSLARPHLWRNSITSFTPMVVETAQGCDHYLHGVGGLEESLDDFRVAYQKYLESKGGTLTKRLHHDIDAEAFALSHADVYTVYPIPMSDARMIRFMAPWVPRAHRGHGERLVIETTLVAPRDALPTDPDYALHETRVDGGVFLADVHDAHKDHTTSRLGPWGNPHPLRAIPAWPAWQALSGISPLSDALVGLRRHDTLEVIVMKNVLFTTDPNQAHQRWALIDQVRRAIADAAKLALESFIRTEAALFPNNGYQSNVPAPIPDEEWVTLTDRDAIRTFDLPEVGNIYQQDADDGWISSDTETNPSESELELASHRLLPPPQHGNQKTATKGAGSGPAQKRGKRAGPAPQDGETAKRWKKTETAQVV